MGFKFVNVESEFEEIQKDLEKYKKTPDEA